ncbi:Gfo/Idh/MocA family protein [Halohasta litorea]|uniref:Gfo/Idh/MocA family oxidoreductase n=1 Tax=Halohasta litorea TaxID=869891 RepID=A0ABD6D9D0_9EURY|nr:Gfo/Idh/MocA family oxidoreductase [Halohasta litorea]MEA1931129.1 Gfo/Idh/MocA family oxidoreductase [Euryarchaeota archaeon]
MTERLAVGVIGVGSMGQHHARVYHELPTVDLVGVADVDAQQATETAEQYGTTPMSVDSLLSVADAVSIVVPTAYHYEMGMAAIEADVDLLIEKPIADDPATGRELLTAADDAGLTLQVGHVERFNPAVRTLSELATELDVIALDCQRLGPPTKREIDDGVAMDLMIHDADILLSLVEAPVADIYAAETAADQYVAATVEFENGIVATLTASRVTQQKVRTLSVTAEDCRVTVDYMAQSVRINRHSLPEYIESDGDVRYRHENITERPTVENGEPLKKELASFIETVRTGGEPVVSAADGIRALEFVRRVTDVAARE